LILAALTAATTAGAQAGGVIAGTVHDQTGRPLAGVRIVVKAAEVRTAESDHSGVFRVTELVDGSYDVSAELEGFQPVQRVVQVRAGQFLSLSLTLQVTALARTLVTASKEGEQDVQSLPLAITALSDRQISRLGIVTGDQAAIMAPAVTFAQNTGFGQLSIRGIGANAIYAGADPSSVMYLDGVYLARPAMAFTELLDLDRIEVLRGPQGTLYGRNAVGGAVSMVSRLPSNELQASAKVSAGNLSTLRGEAKVSGPLKRDRIMASAAVVKRVQDGYVRDLEHPDHPLGGDDVTALRGQVLFVLNRRSNLLVFADANAQDGTPLTFNKVLAIKPGFEVSNPADLHEVRATIEASNRMRHNGTAARFTVDLTPSTRLTSLTAYRTLDFAFLVDSDITELDLATFSQHEQQHQWSEEVTVSHDQPGLTWVGGTFLFGEADRQALRSPQTTSGAEIRLLPNVDASSRAVYGQANVQLWSTLSATAGVRYTREGKEIENSGGLYRIDGGTPVAGTTYQYADAITHDAWTPKLGLELKLPGAGLAYLAATRGFKSGGFNPSSNVPGRGFAPEWVWNYEAGWKGSALNRNAQFALTAFVMDYTNLQVQTPIQPGVYDIRNAAAATVRGVEGEATARFGGHIQAGGHLTWLDATYDRYLAVAVGGATGDVSGNRLNNAPEWAGHGWIEWTAVNSGLSAAVDASAQSTVFYTPFNDRIQRQLPYGLLGARLAYAPHSARWSAAAYARNLTNTDYVMATFGTSPAAFGGRPGASRQFAIEFTVRR